MTHSYNHCMVTPANLRLDNLLASLSLNLAEEGQQALERASGLTGSATTALLALEEFLDGAHVGRLAAVLGLTHSGAVRVVTQLERDGLAERHEGADRRRVEVGLTTKGRKGSRRARAARGAGLPGAGRADHEGPEALAPAPGGTGRGPLERQQRLDRRRGPRTRGAAGQGGLRTSRQPRRVAAGEGHRGLVVSHLRLHRLRPARGPLPGATDRRASDRSIGWPRSHPDRPEPAGRDRWMDPASPSGQAERRATPSSTATVRR